MLIPSYQTYHWPAGAAAGADRPSAAGLSAGAELGGVSVYPAEIATPGRKGFTPAGSRAVAAGCHHRWQPRWALPLNAVLEPSAISDWGWRIPFLFGCLIVPFIFILRRKLEETQEFTARRHHLAMRQVFATLPPNCAGGYRRDDDGGDDHSPRST